MSSLTFDPRLYDLARQSAITTIEEALVELVTNSHDAYTSVENTPGGENLAGLPIWIETDLLERKVIVRDNAKGMTATEMQNKLLVIGSLTADEFTRGLIGRGAKDISNLGDVKFFSIKDNVFSHCNIYSNLTGEVVLTRPCTDDDRAKYQIPGNGMQVEVSVSTLVDFPNIETMHRSMTHNYMLRKLYTESSHPIMLNGKRLTYTYPEAEEVLDIEFTVPHYPGATASLKLYKTKEVIPNPPTDLELRSGVLISSSQSVYECSGLFAHNSLYTTDFRWNPNMKRIYGELSCDYIDKLAREISTEGKSVENPFLIFDPNRRNGLHKKHPFTIALFEIPYRWLEIVLNKIQDERDEFLITNQDVGDMLSSIESMLQENLPMDKTLYTWRSKTDQENLNSMVGHITKLNVNKDVVNIDSEIIDHILKGDDVVPVTKTVKTNHHFDIKLSQNKDMTKPFEVFFYSDKISIRINAHDETIEPFITLDEESGTITADSEASMVAINRVLQDAVVYMMTRQTLMSTSTPTVSDTNHLNEILEIQTNAKQSLRDYSYSIFQSIHQKFTS